MLPCLEAGEDPIMVVIIIIRLGKCLVGIPIRIVRNLRSVGLRKEVRIGGRKVGSFRDSFIQPARRDR